MNQQTEHVIIGVDPHKLSATIEVVDQHGHNRKTDAHDAHAVAAVAVRTKNLRGCSSPNRP
jgi:hypothetical protein